MFAGDARVDLRIDMDVTNGQTPVTHSHASRHGNACDPKHEGTKKQTNKQTKQNPVHYEMITQQ